MFIKMFSHCSCSNHAQVNFIPLYYFIVSGSGINISDSTPKMPMHAYSWS